MDYGNLITNSVVASATSITSIVVSNLWPILKIAAGIVAISLVGAILLALLSGEKFNKI